MHVGHFRGAEGAPDYWQQALILHSRPRPLARKVLGHITIGQGINGRRHADHLKLGERVAASVDVPLQFACTLTCCDWRPGAGVANGDAPLTTIGPSPVVQHVGSSTGRRHSQAEAWHNAVVVDLGTLRRRRQSAHACIREARCPPYFRVRTVSVKSRPRRVTATIVTVRSTADFVKTYWRKPWEKSADTAENFWCPRPDSNQHTLADNRF